MTTLFIAFVASVAAVIVALIARYVAIRAAVAFLVGLVAWFIYVGLMGYSGIVRNPAMRPPGVTLIVGPVLVFLVIFIFNGRSSTIALAFPLWILLAGQSFRIGVELFLHQLWIDGLVPRMLTFAGANVDILTGVSAPIIAWSSTRGRTGVKLAFAWNVLGLLALANVVARSVLTSPGPFNLIHAEVPNLMMTTFPFLFIPAFFVPLAAALHVLALKAIDIQLHPAGLNKDASAP